MSLSREGSVVGLNEVGTIEFEFSDTKFSKNVEDYFLPFEDECTQCWENSHIVKTQIQPKLN